MLRLEGVNKSFGGVHAVSDLTMDVPRGKITGLIGPNGAGKTTVINLITGTLKLTSGRVILDGADVAEEEPDVIARRGISRTFQNIRLLPEATVLENVMIGFHRHEHATVIASMLGLKSSRRETETIRCKSIALLERFGLSAYTSSLAGSLSYGHQRRVEMARAVASDPMILLLDEPVAGMNDVEANKLGDIFDELVAANIGLVLIEHNVSFVTRMCDNVYVLASGRLIAQGPPRDVMRDKNVVVAYLGKT